MSESSKNMELAGFRAGADPRKTLAELNPLADLLGTWMGKGWSVIAVPDHRFPPEKRMFVLKVNAFQEILTFTSLGAEIPNRGISQDELLFGVKYEQRISDAETGGALHVENGMWLLLPSKPPNNIVRQSSIPHGDALLAMGTSLPELDRAPDIGPLKSVPDPGPGLHPGYSDQYTLPIIQKGLHVADPSVTLRAAFQEQTITRTRTLKVSTLPHLSTGGPDPDPFAGNGGGSVLNIPFITKNANVTAFSSTFWIETVAAPETSALPGQSFQQLQYAQDITLEFFDRPDGKGKIKWPHITIATLVKQ